MAEPAAAPSTKADLHWVGKETVPAEPTAPVARVALILESSVWGGVEVHTLELARTIARRGHPVVIVEVGEAVFDGTDLSNDPRIRVRNISLTRPAAEVGFLRWWSVLRELRCEVGVLAKSWFFTGSTAFDLAARAVFRRYVVIEHLSAPPLPERRTRRHLGGLISRPGLWWYWSFLRNYSRSIGPSHLIGVSQRVRDRLVNEYGYPKRKLTVVPSGIAFDRFHPKASWRAESRARWNVPPEALVFGTVGRLDARHKGQDIALDLFAELCARYPERSLRYVLVGDGPDRESLLGQAQSLGVSDRVVFAGGTDRPWEAYCGIDVFLLPSRFEGGPLVLLEAIGCGCCPIATNVGAAPDMIPAPDMGWLVPTGSREALKNAMIAAVETSIEERHAMAERARQHILGRFRADRQYAKIADVVLGSRQEETPPPGP